MKGKLGGGLFLAIALLLVLCTGAQAGGYLQGVVVNDRPENRLHLRVLPDTQAQSLGKYYTGVRVEVLNDRDFGDWAQVRVRGVEGFMLKTYLRIGGDAYVAPATPSAFVNNPNPADRLNLRSRPDERAQSLGRYYNGTRVTVLGVAGAWYHVDVEGQSGYMRGAYLSLEDAGGGAEAGDAVVNNPNPQDRLHLRVLPDTQAQSLGKYYNGVHVRVLGGSTGAWVRVSVAGVEGYMQSRYLAFGSAGGLVESAMPAGRVNNPRITDRLNLRSRPDEASDSLGRYYNNTRVRVLGVLDGWYHVLVDEDDKTGYMKANYLTVADAGSFYYGAGTYTAGANLAAGFYVVRGEAGAISIRSKGGETFSCSLARLADGGSRQSACVVSVKRGDVVQVGDGMTIERIVASPAVSDKTAMSFAGSAALRVKRDYPDGMCYLCAVPGEASGSYVLRDAAGNVLEQGTVTSEKVSLMLADGMTLELSNCWVHTNG